MLITTLKVNANFKYLWLKSVIDIDLSKHCAQCLVGEYVKGVNGSIKELNNLVLNGNVYYLCGVSYPFKWENNFHLAFVKSDGDSIDFSHNGISIHIDGAKQLPISPKYIDTTHPKAKFKSYSTCRNWQFAHFLKLNQGLF